MTTIEILAIGFAGWSASVAWVHWRLGQLERALRRVELETIDGQAAHAAAVESEFSAVTTVLTGQIGRLARRLNAIDGGGKSRRSSSGHHGLVIAPEHHEFDHEPPEAN